MLRATLPLLLVLPLALPTQLAVDVPALPPVTAGTELTLPGEVSLDGPGGAMPGLAGPVELSLDAPASARCALAESTVVLDPVTGRAPVELGCSPRMPGTQELSISARSPPHGAGSWNGTLTVEPDTLDLVVDAPEGDEMLAFSTELAVTPTPGNLAWAPVNLTTQAHLQGTPLVLTSTPVAVNATGSQQLLGWTAAHGPGTYTITLQATGPWTQPANASTVVHVEGPPAVEHLELNVTVVDPPSSVALTGDSVNRDGVNKYPGQEVITKLAATNTSQVEVRVLRATGNGTVTLDEQVLEVPADGKLRHTFSAEALPRGLLHVQATAGDVSVARTARIQDAAPDGELAGPEHLIPSEAPLELDLRLLDANFGSTPMDPGPVFGLPGLTWKLFRSNAVQSDWQVGIGPFSGDGTGQAATDRLAWPQGAWWAQVAPGLAQIPVEVTPPAGAEPGSYRLSIYDSTDGDLLASHTFELEAQPTLQLEAGEPVPGEPFPVTARLDQTPLGSSANLTLLVDSRPVANASVTHNQTAELALPQGLAAGTAVTVNGTLHWPSRAPPALPDTTIERTVPALPPRLEPAARVDGAPVSPPLPLHPAAAHEVVVAPGAWDPNGDPFTLSATLQGPDGAALDWVDLRDGLAVVQVPSQAPTGRYNLTLVAQSSDGVASTSLALDVAPLARLSVAGPRAVNLSAGETAEVPLVVRNTGTTPLAGVLLDALAPQGLELRLQDGTAWVAAGDVLATSLAPGTERAMTLQVTASTQAPATSTVTLTLAGVIP